MSNNIIHHNNLQPNETTFLLPSGNIKVRDYNSRVELKELNKEIFLILKRALPVVLAYLLQQAIPLVSLSSLGHMRSEYLSASALANMFAAVTGWSICNGLATALDTLCSQAFTGSGNPHLVGIYFQRGILLSILIFCPISLLWWYSYDLLIYLNIDEELSLLCNVYLKVLLIGALPYIIFENLKKFLQSQEIMNATTYILIIIFPINIALNYTLVNHPTLGLGFIGAPLAVSICNWLMLMLGICYAAFIKGKDAWGGFSKQALVEWGPFLKLGVPGILMICSEWWAFEIIGLLIAYLGNTQLASYSIIMSTASLFYTVPMGLSVAASNRIGNQLGNGKSNAARLTAYSSIILSLFFGFCNSGILTICRNVWPYLFTDDDLVASLVSKLLPIVALYQVFDGIAAVSGGLLRGQGKQSIGAIVNLTGYYIIALPIGYIMGVQYSMGVRGFWWGLCLTIILCAIYLLTVILRTNWKKEVENCKQRILAEALYSSAH